MQQAPSPAGAANAAGQQEQQAAGSSSQQHCGGDGGCGSGGGGCGDPPPAPAAAAEVQEGAAPPPGTTCMKCRKQQADVVARGREPLCYPCLEQQLLSKVRNAVRMHSLILPGDTVALAYSGGLGSSALLHLLAQLRNPRTDRPARGKVSFTLHIIHIDESAVLGLSSEQQAAQHAAIQAAVAAYCSSESEGTSSSSSSSNSAQYHCVPLESFFEAEEEEGQEEGDHAAGGAGDVQQRQQQQRCRQRLQQLLASVRDETGREDLARHLRNHLLLRTAAQLGCGRVARGESSTTLAAHIVAAASKGCGYSLPGDIHLTDARHGSRLPSLFFPLREVSSRELSLACTYWRLLLPRQAPAVGSLATAAAASKKNINCLAAAFIAGMETHNPGSVPNILNTIAKLEAFPWNDPAQAQQHAAAANGPQQEQQGNGAAGALQASWVLCPICLAPLADDELPGISGSSRKEGGSNSTHTSSGTAQAAAAGCCLSCSSQILGNNPEAAIGTGGGGSVAAALPAAMQRRMKALAAAGQQVAGTGCNGGAGSNNGSSGSSSSVDRLRAQIAEFLLE